MNFYDKTIFKQAKNKKQMIENEFRQLPGKKKNSAIYLHSAMLNKLIHTHLYENLTLQMAKIIPDIETRCDRLVCLEEG